MKQRKKLLLLFTLIFIFTLVWGMACTAERSPGPAQPTPSPPTPVAPPPDTSKAQLLAKKVNELKEVNSATVVVAEDKAWVGVDLAASLKNKLTDKLKDEITKKVKENESTIKTVYVTADADMVTRLRNIAKDIANGKPLSGFMEELDELGRRITPRAN
ncbi:MAG TPA: YhcN/YlaJ family sporulation lipoprotein [Clostridia bacterium]|nr:YhcN/YlaJ family sporulation lipoprotein [Clostridia bacterium]